MSGFSELGAALGGMGQSQENSYQTGMLRGAQGADLLEQARQRRNKNLALAALTPEKFQAAQADPTGTGSSDLAAALVQGGVDSNQVAEYLKNMQGVGMRGQAWQAATRPGANVASLNPMLAVIDGKPVAVTGVEGNTLLNKYVDPNQEAAVGGNVPTAVGQSDITAALARAGASNASAARQYAGIGADKAANHEIITDENGDLVNVDRLTNQTAPILSSDGKPVRGKAGKGSADAGKVPPSLYEAVLGKPLATGKPNPAQQQFQAFMALHPEMSDMEGLRAFASASQNMPTGNFGDPKNPANAGATYSTPSSIGEALGSSSIPTIAPVPASMAEALNSANTAPLIPGKVNASGDYTPPTGAPAKPESQAEFDALPKGAQFINPSDGRLMVKK